MQAREGTTPPAGLAIHFSCYFSSGWLPLVLLGLFMTDLDRKRRQLADMLDRVEPLVDRSRRLHLRSMRGSNSSLFYTDNLLDELEHEVTVVERQKGYAPPTDTGLFSLRPGRRYVSLESRIAGLEALSQAEREDAPPRCRRFSRPTGGHRSRFRVSCD
jgi:hypothetical protein